MPIDLASAEDVKCLLQDAMPSNVVIPTTSKQPTTTALSPPAGRIDGAAAVVVAPAAAAQGAAAKAPDQVSLFLNYFGFFLCRHHARFLVLNLLLNTQASLHRFGEFSFGEFRLR